MRFTIYSSLMSIKSILLLKNLQVLMSNSTGILAYSFQLIFLLFQSKSIFSTFISSKFVSTIAIDKGSENLFLPQAPGFK